MFRLETRHFSHGSCLTPLPSFLPLSLSFFLLSFLETSVILEIKPTNLKIRISQSFFYNLQSWIQHRFSPMFKLTIKPSRDGETPPLHCRARGMQKLTLTGRSWWWPFPCRVCGTSPTALSPRASPWDRPRPRPPPDDGEEREGGGGLRGGGAAPEGAARCAASPEAREAWAASSLARQGHLDDDGATLPPRPPARLLPRACADPSLSLEKGRKWILL